MECPKCGSKHILVDDILECYYCKCCHTDFVYKWINNERYIVGVEK